MTSKKLILIAQCIILFICVAYIFEGYYVNINPDKKVKETFKQTDCFLLSKKLVTKGHVISQYRADFRVSYTVNNAQYTKWVSGNGLDSSFTYDNTEQENMLSRFENGATYPCWYNPEDHGQVVLVMRKNWTATYSLMVPSVIFIIIAYYFSKGIMRFYRTRKTKPKSKRRSKR
jgi:hypothetical protein